MTRIESVCRMLRDVGIFLLGVAAVTMTVHYLFIRVDPVADMQKARLFVQSRAERDLRCLSRRVAPPARLQNRA